MDLISTAEAARRLGITVSTLNRRATSGSIPVAVQVPGETGARLYDAAVIDQLATDPAA